MKGPRARFGPLPVILSAAVFALGALALYIGALIDARLTECPELAAGRVDGLSFIGQGVSFWPIGAECQQGVYETANWFTPLVLALGVVTLVAPCVAHVVSTRRRRLAGSSPAGSNV